MQIKTSLPHLTSILGLLLLLTGCGPGLPDEVALAYTELPKTLDFNIHVRPILSDKCFLCHGPDAAKISAGLQLHGPEQAYAELPEHPGTFAIVPGKPGASEMVRRILAEDPDLVMPTPKSNLELTAREKAVLVKWIEQGAKYKDHWAFTAPDPGLLNSLPGTSDPAHIDHYIKAALDKNNLQPAPEADRDLLLRRLSFDLTGLPPTPVELAAFRNDRSATAYEKQVDRLLASRHYGERMAVDWLDLARYADTHGYLVDRYREMSPWRDWVIKAFNENQPYDAFLTWQLAGDLLPDATHEQILATGFNRLHPQNLEDGIIEEEFRVAYVSDRADVMSTGILGLTAACAKCHDHKYDPISQKNYYELFGFFNNINEAGLIPWEGSTPVPALDIPTERQREITDFLSNIVTENEAKLTPAAETDPAALWVDRHGYRNLSLPVMPARPLAHFSLNSYLGTAAMKRMYSASERPTFTKGLRGQGLKLDGEAWLDLDKTGVFQRSEPFSVDLYLWLPQDLRKGYVFHKGLGTRIHGYRGFHLYLDGEKLELLMAHSAPDNAIIKSVTADLPHEQWVRFTVTYDGSSRAAGYKLYLDNEELNLRTDHDNLTRDIIFHDMVDAIYPGPIEPGIKVGGRWRGAGLKGAVLDDLSVYDRELTALEILGADAGAVKALKTVSPNLLTHDQRDQLRRYYQHRLNRDYQRKLSELQATRTRLIDSVETIPQVMVMRDMKDTIRPTFVLDRGVYDAHADTVTANVLTWLLPLEKDGPKNRLDLANWLTDPRHPLTARVAVNRYWQMFFGRGIVRTTEDFGSQGELPSHPELLDWLALRFVDSGWDVKELVKTIVLSATYRQSSLTSPELREFDPANVLLARGPAGRLPSEMIRDNALAASGLLNDKIGGKSVKPYQPKDLWKMNNATYVPDSGQKLYRRSLYVLWKRTVPHPTLATFDAPNRDECTVRRQETNTPLQALVLLNDPAFVEAAKVIGERITQAPSPEAGITDNFERLTGRPPEAKELSILLETQRQEFIAFQHSPGKADGWLKTGEYILDPTLDTNLLAANAVVASVMLNSDAAISKR